MADEQKVITNFAEQTSSDTDDDVSVIAVIGKCSNIPNVPKHAKYYARKLPTKIGVAAANLKFSKEKIKTIVADELTREMKKNNDSINTRVIELSDKNSKMELRKQFKVETASPDNSENSILLQGTSGNYESLEILQKLPPGTVLIKQNAKGYREDSDYLRESSKDSTETNSSGSSSTTSVVTEKVKRLHRTARNKKIVEVRRNPMRVSKRDVDKDFPRPRQRLLTAKRKEGFSELVPTKRTKVSTMPYMNTRSVTRKLYTVGATYQAPTVRDETEWKEWPVHGMHERPVFHPQFGLAVEYVGRFFTSLDGCTYREILDEPEIEVVSVDPHPERVLLPNAEQKTRNKRMKNQNDQENVSISKDNSFEVCMHNSLHNVFAYCAQVMSPAYEKDVEQKIAMIRENPTQLSLTLLKNDVVTLTESDEVVAFPEEHCKKKLNQINITKDSTTSLVVPHDSSINLLKVKSAETNYEERQEDYKRSIRNTALTFVKATDTISNYDNVSKVTSNELNFTKLEDSAISDETLMEMSSIYKKLVPTEDLISSCENSPTERTFCKRPTVKYALPKMVNKSTSSRGLDFSGTSEVCQGNAKMAMVKEANSSDILPCYTINAVKNIKNSSIGKLSNETSEIARILSEYNQSVKRPNVQNTYYSPSKRSTMEILWSKLKRIEVENCQSDEKNNEVKSKSKVVKILTSELAEYKSRPDKWKGLTAGLKKERILETIEEFSKNSCGSTSESRSKENLDIVGRSKVTVPVLKVRVDHNVTEDIGKSRGGKGTACGNDKSSKKTQFLQELLENTAVLYCAATGVHEDDLVGYVDSLDTKQSVQWMETQNSSVFK